jgi:hypothetical protein
MTTDDLINLIVFMPGHRTVSVRWSRGGCESHRIETQPGELFGKDYGVIERLQELFDWMLMNGSGPVTLQHNPYPESKETCDGDGEYMTIRAFQFEAADGQWRLVPPRRVRKRFQRASVHGSYSFGWLEM